MMTRHRRRIALAAASLAAVAAMTGTLIHPAAAHTPTGTTADVPANLPLPIPTPTPKYYGAIAVAENGSVGKAWRHTSRAEANQRALTLCGHDSCTVVSSFTRCGALAHDGSTYHGGVGHTRGVAETNAIDRLGGGTIVHWACN